MAHFPKAHWNGRQFVNQETHTNNFGDFWKWQRTRHLPEWPSRIENCIFPNILKQVTEGVTVTYVNHATVLVQCDGLNILTDPWWSERASPFSFIGPKRIYEPGIPWASLPPIDIVLISHNHYDHLDLPTVKQLQERFKPLFLVGLRMGQYLKKIAKHINYKELDWGDSHTHHNVRITFTPAHHWSSRSLLIKNDSLWGGFVIESSVGGIYFAGDTGWGKHFGQIATAFPSLAIALLPIGSYEPRWFMRYSHIDPFEAVRAHLTLKAKWSMGIHFNCIKYLGDDAYNQAVIDLDKARTEHNLPPEAFVAPKPGEQYHFASF